jgi:hypothetical protein
MGTLFAAAIVTVKFGSIKLRPIKLGAVAARLEGALLAVAAARRAIAAGAVIAVDPRLVAEIAARSVAVVAATRRAPLAKGALVAIALSGKILGPEAALGKLLLRSPRGAGAAFVASLAAARPVTPAAGVVVFVVVAGHEGLTEGVG